MNAMSAPENTAIILKGLRRLSDLDPEEKYKFDSVMTGFFVLIESDFISTDAQLLSGETRENRGYFLRHRYLGYPGMQDWWKMARHHLDKPVQEWVDKQISLCDPNFDYWGIM